MELKRVNLIFAENGRGKTTLCAILRSLQSGDAAFIIGRTTLGSTDQPEVEILTTEEMKFFRNGSWTGTDSNITVFDSMFVSENVYAGDVVSIGHKRGLYSVVVGRQGVELAQQIVALDGKSRLKATDVTEKTAAVRSFAPRGMSVDDFSALQEDGAIVDKIQSKEKELAGVRDAAQISTRGGLRRLNLPMFDRKSLDATLNSTVEGIAKNAERLLKEHVAIHKMHSRGQPWLSEGVGYIQENKCPFCGRDLDAAADLITAYRDFFSAEYNKLRDKIAETRRQIEADLSDQTIAEIERTIDRNVATMEFWARFCEIAAPSQPVGLAQTLRVLRGAAIGLLDRKAASPLENVEEDPALSDAWAAYVALQGTAADIDRAVSSANAIIEAKKKATGSADLTVVEAALARLRAVKTRYEPEVSQACNELNLAQLEKAAIEEQKAAVRRQLDDFTEGIIGRYQDTINGLLDNFNAGFRISGFRHGYPGGVASSTYQIRINEVAVDLGDSETPLDKASFGNTLSGGDRSTLALAFFLSQLTHDPDKANKIVIFDDPFSSQDAFRRDCTIHHIKKVGRECAQVIVLSHEQTFLKRTWDLLPNRSSVCKCLEFKRVGQRDTAICEWDIDKASQARYEAGVKSLRDFCEHGLGDPLDVVQKIRPVLESHCKSTCSGLFEENEYLGDMIAKIRNAGSEHQLHDYCDELEQLNDYSKRYYHGDGTRAGTDTIDNTELAGFAQRTLTFTGRC